MASAEVAQEAKLPPPALADGIESTDKTESSEQSVPVPLHLSQEQVERYYEILKGEGEEEASSHLSEVLSLRDYQFDSRSAIKLDYTMYALEFAQTQGFGSIRTTAFFKLASDVLEACMGGGSFLDCQEILKSRLLAMTSHKPGDDTELLSAKHVAETASFFSRTFFRHFRLYSIAFTEEQGFTQHEAHLMVETACVPSFDEAISELEKEIKEAEEKAEMEAKQAAEAEEAARLAAEAEADRKAQEEAEAEAARQAELLRKPATLDEAIQHLVAARLTEEKEALAKEYEAKEAALTQKLTELKEKLPEPVPETKGKKK